MFDGMSIMTACASDPIACHPSSPSSGLFSNHSSSKILHWKFVQGGHIVRPQLPDGSGVLSSNQMICAADKAATFYYTQFSFTSLACNRCHFTFYVKLSHKKQKSSRCTCYIISLKAIIKAIIIIWPEQRAKARWCFLEAGNVVLCMIAAMTAICAWLIASVAATSLRLCPSVCHTSSPRIEAALQTLF